MRENINGVCVLCSNNGGDVNLQSTTLSMPSYIPEKGKVHLICLKTEVNKHISHVKYKYFPIILAIGFFTGLILVVITSSLLYFITPIIISYSILLFMFLPNYLSRNMRLMKWILKQQKLNETLKDNSEITCILCGRKEVDLPEYIKKKGKMLLNLLSIPCLLPNYLPKEGNAHLDCLENTVSEYRNYLNEKILYLLWIFIFSTGSISGFLLWHLLESFNYFVIIATITYFVTLSTWLPYLLTPTHQLRNWIKKQYSNENE